MLKVERNQATYLLRRSRFSVLWFFYARKAIREMNVGSGNKIRAKLKSYIHVTNIILLYRGVYINFVICNIFINILIYRLFG